MLNRRSFFFMVMAMLLGFAVVTPSFVEASTCICNTSAARNHRCPVHRCYGYDPTHDTCLHNRQADTSSAASTRENLENLEKFQGISNRQDRHRRHMTQMDLQNEGRAIQNRRNENRLIWEGMRESTNAVRNGARALEALDRAIKEMRH